MAEFGARNGLMNIGEEVKTPFAVLPDPASLFRNRSKRSAALAPDSQLKPCLEFPAPPARVQHKILAALPGASLPPLDRSGHALEHGMPRLSRTLSDKRGGPNLFPLGY